MNDAMKQVSDGLVKAMQAEIDGHNFYRMASLTTQDVKGKAVFEQMAREEMSHYQFLKQQYQALQEKGRVDEALKLGRPEAITGTSPIFSDAIKTRIKEAHFEMTALSVAIQLEHSAIQFYTDQAKASPTTAIKQFYTELAEWESGHYHALLQQQDLLRSQYWTEAGFAPF